MKKWLPRISKFLVAFVLFVVLFYAGMQWYVHDTVEKGLQEAVEKVPDMELNYSRLDVNFRTYAVTLTEVDLRKGDERFFADKVVFSDFDQRHEVPHAMSVKADGVVLPVDVPHLGPLASLFKELGMVELRGDCTLDYAFDPGKNALQVQDFRFRSPELGDFTFRGGFGGVNIDEFRPESLVGLQILGMDISFADSGLMDRVLDVYSMHRNMDREEARAFVSSEVGSLAAAAKVQGNEQAMQAFLNLGEFVKDPGTLVIKATPEEPVPWLYFFMGRDVFESIRLLDLLVESRAAGEEQ
ncbi:hypothetical protein [Salidesulfovibrio onnuriiensis]|uniref:hypothetical protein n=1 Tax=Salidesulfovibrio onnuriiensis TaxID=2583823 RepID=UPI0011CB3CD4|nr:hypothetical protein [Salidesulfovibrio onnuriiensis]